MDAKVSLWFARIARMRSKFPPPGIPLLRGYLYPNLCGIML